MVFSLGSWVERGAMGKLRAAGAVACRIEGGRLRVSVSTLLTRDGKQALDGCS